MICLYISSPPALAFVFILLGVSFGCGLSPGAGVRGAVSVRVIMGSSPVYFSLDNWLYIKYRVSPDGLQLEPHASAGQKIEMKHRELIAFQPTSYETRWRAPALI